ncbi:CPBP family intramembrane glutamic endopeptidase [Seonamhaeicola marinus]|uniref:CPBP family intramembrane metalloprotease n=1 Tax=Seonamhaeicola marinus TaxID=1912246 RepID=A0A5D0HZQ5_9FLAO|nr:CPBP family intramembrane glutamic endopeptidase [Seonamhaeicola marinus]TYA75002.1 CPBP family intramembrane metalloprotease [Seonamhaeicola marinus]
MDNNPKKLTSGLTTFSKEKLISDKRRICEILAVVITALGKFVFMDFLNFRLPYVVFAILVWSLYIYNRSKKEKGILKHWGFRIDNFTRVCKIMLPFGIVSILSFLLIGSYQNTINLTWHILPLLITYPIWGTVQQFLTISLIAGNLRDLRSKKLSKVVIVCITAVLFSVVHYPSVWLMIGTFVLALFYGILYLKEKNVFAMGLFHGWLGAVFYYTVVNKDPFQEIFLNIIN